MRATRYARFFFGHLPPLMATVPPNPDGAPELTLHLPLVPPHTRGGRHTLLGAPPQVPDTTRHCAAPRVQVIFAPQTRQFFHQRVALTTTGKCAMEMRTPPGNGLHPPITVLRTENQRGACAKLKRTAGPDRDLHRLPTLRQPTDLRRNVRACQNLFEVWHLQEGARIINLAQTFNRSGNSFDRCDR